MKFFINATNLRKFLVCHLNSYLGVLNNSRYLIYLFNIFVKIKYSFCDFVLIE